MSWKLIPSTYIGPDAAGAGQDTSYDMGYLFFDQAKEVVFRIGNTGAAAIDFKVSASGSNSNLVNAVEFSKDHYTWVTEVHYSGIQPNEISDTCWTRFTCPKDGYITSGTFLIRIDEI